MPSRLETLLELALRTSTANNDPYKDDLRYFIRSSFQLNVVKPNQSNPKANQNEGLLYHQLTRTQSESMRTAWGTGRRYWPSVCIFASTLLRGWREFSVSQSRDEETQSILGSVFDTWKLLCLCSDQWTNISPGLLAFLCLCCRFFYSGKTSSVAIEIMAAEGLKNANAR